MKRKYIAAALCMAFVCMFTGCNQKTTETSSKSSSAASSIVVSEEESTEQSQTDESSGQEEISEQESTEESEEESSEETSDEQESSEEESSEQESSEEQISMTESEAIEVSIDGYQFDDELIVKDYHTAKEFTDNEDFNGIFNNNALDAGYNTELRTADTISQMRSITISYVDKWKLKADDAYNSLYEELADKPEEREKLEASQEQWKASLSETENSFVEEAKNNGGTEALLSADAAMMNYYKGRAAILLEQIYELKGDIDLSTYGL